MWKNGKEANPKSRTPAISVSLTNQGLVNILEPGLLPHVTETRAIHVDMHKDVNPMVTETRVQMAERQTLNHGHRISAA